MKTAIINGKIITPHRILDQASLVMEDGVIAGIVRGRKPEVHYVDFGKWYVRLIAGLVVFLVIFLVMTVFFGIMGLAGWILSYIWPVLLVMLAVWMFRGPRR